MLSDQFGSLNIGWRQVAKLEVETLTSTVYYAGGKAARQGIGGGGAGAEQEVCCTCGVDGVFISIENKC